MKHGPRAGPKGNLPGVKGKPDKLIETAVIVTDSGFLPIDIHLAKQDKTLQMTGWHRSDNGLVYRFERLG